MGDLFNPPSLLSFSSNLGFRLYIDYFMGSKGPFQYFIAYVAGNAFFMHDSLVIPDLEYYSGIIA